MCRGISGRKHDRGIPCKNTCRKRRQRPVVRLDRDLASITYSKTSEFFRGLGFVKEWITENRTVAAREEHPVFEHLTYMADCSRNGVCSPDHLRRLMVKLSLMGYDRLMLYTEDTYQVEGYPYSAISGAAAAGRNCGNWTGFAASLGIEMVPCIQTLAHLNAIFRWPAFKQAHDTGDILLCGSDDTYNLIEAMIRTWSETFKSRVINIGMDEAEMIGRGSYLNQFGYEERIDIMERHLHRVLEICEKYGYTAMMWSDMFFENDLRRGILWKGISYLRGNQKEDPAKCGTALLGLLFQRRKDA